MPTAVTGNPTGVATPAVQPGPDTFVVTSQPIAGEGATAASVNQATTALANEQAWEKKPTAAAPAVPTGLDAATVQPIKAYRNARGQRRDFVDHRGDADMAHITRWHEYWDSVGMVAKTTGSGAWAGRWNYSINVGNGAPLIQRGTWTGIPTPPNYPGGTLTLDSGDVIGAGPGICVVEADPMSGLWLNEDSDIVAQFEVPQNGGTTDAETVWGITTQSQIGSTGLFAASNPIAMGFIVRSGDTTIHFYYYNGSGSPVIVDTGVASATRFRIEYQGTNASDDSTARILLYIDGAVIKNIAIDFTPTLPATPTIYYPFVRLLSTGSRRTAAFGAVDFAGPRWPGDVAY
jgi:hypothetical protein